MAGHTNTIILTTHTTVEGRLILNTYEYTFRMISPKFANNSKFDPIYGRGRQSVLAGLTVTQQIPRCSSAPFAVGQEVEGYGGDVYEVLSIRKIKNFEKN